MAPIIQTFNQDASLSDIVSAIQADGAVIVKDLLPASTVEEMNTLVQPYMDAQDPDYSHTLPENMDGFNFLQSRTHRIYGLLGKLPGPVSEILQHPIWTGIMESFLSDETTEWIGETEIVQSNTWQLTLSQSFTILPGCKMQPLHRDQLIHTFQPSESKIHTSVVTCGIVGTKFTKKNGATRIVPGSHIWAKGRLAKAEEIAYAEAEVGSGIFWLGSTIHGGGANECKDEEPDSIRQMFAIGGSRDWCKPDENFFLSTPWQVWKTLPRPVLERVGWLRTSGGAGYLDGEDPIDQIDELPKLSVAK